MSEHLPEAAVESADAATPVTPEQIARVRDLAESVVSTDELILDLSRRLTELNDKRKSIVERDLVQAMTEARLEVWPMPGGLQFELANVLNGSIPKDRQEEAFAFLEANGHGDLIKRKFTIQFGRDEVAWAKKFMQDLAKRKKPLNVEQKTWVEPQTLGAFVREQHRLASEEGKNADELVPPTLFGVFKMTFAKLAAPKAPSPRKVKARAS